MLVNFSATDKTFFYFKNAEVGEKSGQNCQIFAR